MPLLALLVKDVSFILILSGMALSTVVFVGKAKEWLPELVERARLLKVSEGMDSAADLGPLITCESKDRVESLIQSGVDQGAELLLDGRGCTPKGFETGNFVGPTILSKVTTNMKCYTEEMYLNTLTVVSVQYSFAWKLRLLMRQSKW